MTDENRWPREVQDAYQDAVQQAPKDRSFFARCIKWLGDECLRLRTEINEPKHD